MPLHLKRNIFWEVIWNLSEPVGYFPVSMNLVGKLILILPFDSNIQMNIQPGIHAPLVPRTVRSELVRNFRAFNATERADRPVLVSVSLIAIFNTQPITETIDGDYQTNVYHTTVPMPTYLLAFVISPYHIGSQARVSIISD